MTLRLKPDEQEAITPGEAIKAMILNGLGFANRPLSLTPQFFAGKPLDLLFRPGVEASMFNCFKREHSVILTPHREGEHSVFLTFHGGPV